jgi:hypothetical protein
MTSTFAQATRDVLRDAEEITIHTTANRDRGVVIWVVEVGNSVFARSFRGAGAKWYKSAIADGRATLALGDRRWPVHVTQVADRTQIDEVSQAYLKKYATSPYAKEMVRPEILPTTVRLDPM